MKSRLLMLTPTLLKLLPLILILTLLVFGAAKAGGPIGPPDWDPW